MSNPQVKHKFDGPLKTGTHARASLALMQAMSSDVPDVHITVVNWSDSDRKPTVVVAYYYKDDDATKREKRRLTRKLKASLKQHGEQYFGRK